MPTATIYAGNNFQSVCNRLNGSTLNGGSNQEGHLPVGYSNTTDSRWRAIIKFPNISAGIPVGARIVKAEVWVKTTGSTVHVGKGSNARMKISRINQGENPGFSGGSGEGWYTSANPAGFSLGSSTAITYAAEGNPGNGVVKKYDITDFVEDWLSSNYIRRDGGACRNYVNNGIEIKSYDENSGTRTSEFWSTRGGYEPRLVVEYTTEADPNPPTVNDPTPGDKATAPTSASVAWADGTGDEGRFYIGTAEDDVSVYDSGWAAVTPGGSKVYDLSGVTWPVGQTLYCEARSRNDLGVVAQSGSTQIYILPVPTVSIAAPSASNGLCRIHNLGDLSVWTDGGAHAMPEVQVTYTHPTGVSAQDIEVSVDNGATWHSFGDVASGGTKVCKVPQAVLRDTAFVIKARATGGAGQVSAEVSRSARVNFGQAVYGFTPSAGASSFVSRHDTVQGGGQAAYAYRVAGSPTWLANASSLPAGTTNAEMLVRLSTTDAGTQPTIDDLSIEYQKTPPAAPDFWTPVNCVIELDGQFRRFGVHSLKVVPGGSWGRVEQSQHVEVSPNTIYTMSVYINTLGQQLDDFVQLFYERSDGTRRFFNQTDHGSDYLTKDSTGKGAENWQRLRVTFDSEAEELIKPGIYAGAMAQDFRIDSIQLESGRVASSWRPGTLGPAVILDVGGVAIDGKAGGIFRARGSGGEVVTLGANGLELDGVPYVTAADMPALLAPVRTVYDTPGSYTFTPDPLALYAEVEVIGGGGGGGGALGHASNTTAASAGGGGGYVFKRFAQGTLPASCNVVVGAGGAGGAAGQNNGNDGGYSEFTGTGITDMIAGPGLAGESSGTALNQYHHGGFGGTASGGDINNQGGQGGTSRAISGLAFATGGGGANGKGEPGQNTPENWHGADGINPGSGGSGGANAGSASGVNRSGGNGAPGQVVITEYYQ